MATCLLATSLAILSLLCAVSGFPNLLADVPDLKQPNVATEKPMHLIEDHLETSNLNNDPDLEKRSSYNDDNKRAGQAKFIQAWESALGSMQRPRFGKRFEPYETQADDGAFYNEKRAKSLLEMENALSSIQRPRFGRSALATK